MKLKKVLMFVAFVCLIGIFGYLKAEQGDYDTLGYDTPNGRSFWRVNSSGHLIPGADATLDLGGANKFVRTLYVGSITSSGTVTAINSAISGPLSASTVISSGPISASSATFTGGLLLSARTIAQLDALTPTVTYQIYVCSDCIAANKGVAVAIASGTTKGAFVYLSSTNVHIGTSF